MKTKQTLTALALTTVLAASSSASAATPWCHIQLQSTDGTRIQFDYSKDSSSAGRFGFYWMAQPWIQVAPRGLNGGEQVRVVLSTRNSPFLSPAKIFDLRYDAGQRRFTGQAPEYLIVQTGPTAGNSISRVKLSLSVVVNGDWKKDPVSGSSDFEIDLDQRPGRCDW